MVDQTEYVLHIAATSSESIHAPLFIGTLNQSTLTTPPYPISIKLGKASLPDNISLTYTPSFTVHCIDDLHLHLGSLPTIAELQPTKNTYVSNVYHGYLSQVRSGRPQLFIESTNIEQLGSRNSPALLSFSFLFFIFAPSLLPLHFLFRNDEGIIFNFLPIVEVQLVPFTVHFEFLFFFKYILFLF